MRRAFSILLALLFGLGPLVSALPASEDARLPACCRRMGAHHCAIAAHGTGQSSAQKAQTASDGRAAITAPDTCPNYPGAVMALIAPTHALVALAPDLPVPILRTRALSQADISAHTSPARTHAGRGPPASLLS